ncbi:MULTISPECIES: antibiotic biosynthesis monooxygenase [Bacillaceae]|uniref:antibiotic biosynthesis monooxygenase n=1 Tax=Bacillaceae TaxID=186817 RepID=UPI00217D94F6|nr:antibiotic biosynthesis monooxygenase [Bacillus sp. PK3_68]
MRMMKAVNTIKIKKGRAEEVLSRFARPKAVHTFEGFVLMEVLKTESLSDYDELKICTTWEDRQFFDNWVEGRGAKNAHQQSREQNPEDSPIIGSHLITFEVIYQHKPAAEASQSL